MKPIRNAIVLLAIFVACHNTALARILFLRMTDRPNGPSWILSA